MVKKPKTKTKNPPCRKHISIDIQPQKLTLGDLTGNKINASDLWGMLEEYGELLIVEKDGSVLGLIQRENVFRDSTLNEIIFEFKGFRLVEFYKSRAWNAYVNRFEYVKAMFNTGKISRNEFYEWNEQLLSWREVLWQHQQKEIREIGIKYGKKALSSMTSGRLGKDFRLNIGKLCYDYQNPETRKQISEKFKSSTLYFPEIIKFEFKRFPILFIPQIILENLSATIDRNAQTRQKLMDFWNKYSVEKSAKAKVELVRDWLLSKSSALYQWNKPLFVQSLKTAPEIEKARKKESKRINNIQKAIFSGKQKKERAKEMELGRQRMRELGNLLYKNNF